MNRSRTRLAGIAALSAVAALTLTACADRGGATGEDSAAGGFPDGDITLVVPYDAGGASDLAARTLATQMEESLDASIVVENRSGGAGSVGLDYLAAQEPDGYTIGYLPVETVMLGYQGYDIDPAAYEPLGQMVSVPATIAVPADSEYQTLEDLIAAARSGEVTVANSGTGSIWEAATTELATTADAQLKPVPFDGGAPAVTAAIGGQVDAVVAGISETSPGHADGTLRVLAVFDDEPSPALEGVPTGAEAGHDVVIGGWGALGAPAGLDAEVKETLSSAVSEAAETEDFRKIIADSGNVPMNVPPEDFQPFYEDENERFAAIFGG
ncbi:tripartite tricarboxylate transporter substrate binding protein [Brevibacterium album]|uniref:tripartite tricarboxylate transporter substrate binding protein n=1 Tax=Brevibacterium album TaxID=417948 RepID=UPI0003FC8256|nr:tripartite tricarboxylate transporter substrate binding protein [Brevibacterium album]